MHEDKIIKAAAYIGEKVYSKPYTNTQGSFFRANFYYTCKDGTIIHRPNHNIANVLRTIAYLQPVIDYYALNGHDSIKKNLTLIDQNEIEKIHYILIFYASHRTNELRVSKEHSREILFKHLKEYLNKNNNLDSSPFENFDEVKHYAHLIRASHDITKIGKDKVIALLLESTHFLDSLRCATEGELEKSLFSTFNENSKKKNTRNLQLLIFYAQNCIIATGDKLRTKYQVQDVHGSYHRQGFHLHLYPSRKMLTKTGHHSVVFGGKGYNELQFKKASQVNEAGIIQTLQCLEQVPKPIFFKKVEHTYTAEESLALIEKDDGVIRVINGATNSISLRFELEQLVNPNFMRPIRSKKLKKRHVKYYDLVTKNSVTRLEKDYTSMSNQASISSVDDILFFDINDKLISKQEDRGKPKKTIFSKNSLIL